MTFWSSWAKTLKILIKELSLPLLLFVLIVLFWYFKGFGSGSFNNLFALFLFLGAMLFYVKNRIESLDFLIFLSIFLGFFDLYNLQFIFLIPAWLAELLVLIYTFLLFLYLSYEKKRFSGSPLAAIGLSVCLLELFYALSFWPTNPLSKAFILTIIFYAFWFMIIMKEKILTYLVVIGAATALVLITTRWPLI